MAIFVITLILIILWATAVHFIFKNRITFKEALVQAGAATTISLITMFAIYYKDMGDTAIINGYVTNKERVKVSCSHSYKCRCYTTCQTNSNKTKSCTEHCSTCYDHSYDVDWRVATTVGNLEINRVNRQGTQEPPRWTAVMIGEPASSTDAYVNYVKAAPDSLFSMNKSQEDSVKFANMIPVYPKIYDYYRINRVLNVGMNYSHTMQLNDQLNNSLKNLGAQKQVNIIVIFVKTTDSQYRYALERAWLGGKKNDVIILLGMLDDNNLAWVDTITFGKNAGNEMLSVLIRDSITAVYASDKFANPTILANTITQVIKSDFKRKEMKDFQYLENDYSPSQMAIMVYVLIQLLVLTITTLFFYHFELERGDWVSKSRVLNYRISRRN